jgi:ABC-type antimicrobial peptide transport system permease subunit
VVRDGLRIAGAGIAIGVVAGLLAGRAMRGLVVGVSEFDLATMVASCGVLVAVTVAACLIPARSAARVDPVVTLTVE